MRPCTKDVFFLEGVGGVRLACTRWQPAVESGPLVIFAHGYTAWAEGYLQPIEQLVGAGCVVYALDHRGHGSSGGKRASLDRFDDLVDDLELLVNRARNEAPDRSLFTFGHSMGGLIVTRHAMKHHRSINGVVATSSAFLVGLGVDDTKVELLLLLSRIAPDLPVIDTGNQRSLRELLAGRQQAGSIFSYHGRTRLNLAREIWIAGRNTLIHAAGLNTPVLLQHGGEDAVAAPEGSHICYQRASSRDKTLAVWRGREHNLLTSEGWEDVTAQAIDWILQRSHVSDTVSPSQEIDHTVGKPD